MAYSMALPWHSGEQKIHHLLRVPDQDNPTTAALTPRAAYMLQQAPLLAIGTLDAQKRPWTTIWGGSPGLSRALGNSVIGVKAVVDARFDPVVEAMCGGKCDGEVVREQGQGRMVSGLSIDLDSRSRVKLYGRMVAGAVAAVGADESDAKPDIDSNDEDSKNGDSDAIRPVQQSQIQLVMRIEQSLGNCPKYINRKRIIPATVSPTMVFDSPNLDQEAVNLVAQADLFFISSSNSEFDMDTNHRGGPPGFARLQRLPSDSWELYWPEYSGNRFYQTLGNLANTPLAGLVFPDFSTGSVLYLTGTTEILTGHAASAILTRSNVAVKLSITAARLVRSGLTFRGTPGEASPYNPQVRLLASEVHTAVPGTREDRLTTQLATLMEQTRLTPTISRFRFSMSNPTTRWTAGQWVALDFSEELDIGYSHMRDDDPRSLNDDFVRTFTVSSAPAPRVEKSKADDEFEITVRNVGTVTGYLFRQKGGKGLEVPIRGFGGEVRVEQEEERVTPFVAGGVGITPLLAQLPGMDFERLHVFWTLQIDDLDLVVDLLERHPGVGDCLSLYITGSTPKKLAGKKSTVEAIEARGPKCELRRLLKEDLSMPDLSDRWHVCVSTRLRAVLLEWLKGKEVIYEDFNF